MELPCIGSMAVYDLEGNNVPRMHNCQQMYNQQEAMLNVKYKFYWNLGFHLTLLFIVIFIVKSIVKKIGYKETAKKICYVVSLHWLLKFMIALKDNWHDINKNIDKSVKNIIENDEDMANAMADSNSEHDNPDVKNKNQKNLMQIKKQKEEREKRE